MHMDPNVNIEQQRKLAAHIIGELERITDDGGNTPEEFYADGTVDEILLEAEQLAANVQALDEWRLKGGFDPYALLRERLEYLRGQLRAECISMGELHELQSLAEHIEPGDVELLEAAGVPEFEETHAGGGTELHIPTIEFSDDAIDSALAVLHYLADFTVDLEIPANTGYPCEGVMIVRVDHDGDVVVCETDESGTPLANATWAVPVNLIKKVTVR